MNGMAVENDGRLRAEIEPRAERGAICFGAGAGVDAAVFGVDHFRDFIVECVYSALEDYGVDLVLLFYAFHDLQ